MIFTPIPIYEITFESERLCSGICKNTPRHGRSRPYQTPSIQLPKLKPTCVQKNQVGFFRTDTEKDVDVGNVEVQIKQDPTDGNNYRLHLGGKRVFQWFKEKWQSLKQTVKRGFGIR